jgi:hypothetical protein
LPRIISANARQFATIHPQLNQQFGTFCLAKVRSIFAAPCLPVLFSRLVSSLVEQKLCTRVIFNCRCFLFFALLAAGLSSCGRCGWFISLGRSFSCSGLSSSLSLQVVSICFYNCRTFLLWLHQCLPLIGTGSGALVSRNFCMQLLQTHYECFSETTVGACSSTVLGGAFSPDSLPWVLVLLAWID